MKSAIYNASEVIMKDGFIRAAALTPKIRVADTAYNAEQIERGNR